MIQVGYKWWLFVAKLLSSAAIGVGIWAMSEYGFVAGSWIGITFLNNASLRSLKTKEAAKKAIAQQLRDLKPEEVSQLITELQTKQSNANTMQ